MIFVVCLGVGSQGTIHSLVLPVPEQVELEYIEHQMRERGLRLAGVLTLQNAHELCTDLARQVIEATTLLVTKEAQQCGLLTGGTKSAE